MHVDSYQFGRIVIDGKAYSSDCLILGDCVRADWWREEGHLLAVEDLQSVIAARPSVLVVGCGASGLMRVTEKAKHLLEENDIELVALDTHTAVKKFNELADKGENIAAALHLTC